MSDRQAWDAGISSFWKNIYRCADRSSWYSSVADAYDRTRPRYPAKILARMQETAQLQPGKTVLEIGAGPGVASIELAKSGAKIVCLEPSSSACELARLKCAAYPNVEFIATTFEEWDIAELKFDAVVAATSFHWVAPEVRTAKAAAALKDNGLLILLWNTPPQTSYEVFQSLVEVYQNYAPNLAIYEEHQDSAKHLAKIGEEVINSGYLRNLTSEQLISRVTYSINDYLGLLSTLSPYISLESKQRHLLLAELKRVLELNYGNDLELSYLSLLQIAYKS
ncbi:MAG TPA: methyltransferase domain-containing protein [Coleofasciculaceae cyanobacterium]|jgi:ubiquinone/menaquinone biosynthesis C-methylase UbiE